MSITQPFELEAMKEISFIVADTLKQMREYAEPGMSTKDLDEFGGNILRSYKAHSAPMKMYNFPGYTCICVNEEVAHGIPYEDKILKEGDLVNIDVSAELNGFFGDNGGSFVLGEDIHNFNPLVQASKDILKAAIYSVQAGSLVNKVGFVIENMAKKSGYTVIKNLAGHGVGRSLHEEPKSILNYRDRFNKQKFKNNAVVAIETFISTKSQNAFEKEDGWTLVGEDGGFVAQHEHTLVITEGEPIILTEANGIWN
jgi:methionyl aminopeptidase